MKFLLAFLVASATVAVSSTTLIDSDVIFGRKVTTALGVVTGETLNVNGRMVQQFLGVPYAAPPTGNLRFKRTLPLTKFPSDPLVANRWPNQCFQLASQENPLFALSYNHMMNYNVSEDCLYMNIWAYKGKTLLPNPLVKRPVIVFIHGGGLYAGTASLDVFNGERLAAETESVVVVINYRVGIHGFFYADGAADQYPGNQGLYDQMTALKFVQDHIADFGGDPNKVTLMGESAGAWSVTAHMMSPLTDGLFQNAFIQSGAITHAGFITTPDQYVQKLLVPLRNLGCADNTTTSIDLNVVNCIKSLSPDYVDYLGYVLPGTKYQLLHPLVVSPSEYLPQVTPPLPERRQKVNVLISNMENEGPLFTLTLGQAYLFQGSAPLNLTQAKNDLRDYAAKTFLMPEPLLDLLEASYFNGMNEATPDDQIRKEVTTAVGDGVMTCVTMAFARRALVDNLTTKNVYQMYVTASAGSPKMFCPAWGAPCHGDDVYYAFAYPLRVSSTAQEKAIANEYINIIRNLAHNGRPKSLLDLRWDPFEEVPGGVTQPYMILSNNGRSYDVNLKDALCANIWNYYNLV